MAKSLHDRFVELDKRITALRATAYPVTPEDHGISELLDDLFGRHDRLRDYFSAQPPRSPLDVEQELKAMEQTYDKASKRLPPG